MVLKHFQGAVVTLEKLLQGGSGIDAWYVVGGYASDWVTDAISQGIASLRC